ncbi:hypothetical protein EsDP_00001148 [Epichloe bromicola]|uniref:Uncharacterized protein n=1 Tax=Epichloe bromicola TaxID=79588 RepID=A0ABQ0CGZ3_9HYPO
MLIWRLLLLYLLPSSISSVEGSALTNDLTPRNYNSSDVENYVGYVKDPNGRGTISLVLSCLLTLVLCVWSALHLNVPERNRKGITTIWINFRWILAGIYSPEMVVFAAWRQWCSARMLNGHVQSLLEEQGAGRHDSNATGSVKGPQQCTVTWSMTHSFFACSGGFAVELQTLSGVLMTDTDDAPATDHENVRPVRLTLTARGMMLLADSGHLPVVEKAEIEDKSKANDLAKAAVIVQATWMLIQVMSRLAARLPVTLLEVNTVAHPLRLHHVSLFWWHKPLLPNEPIILRDESLAPLVAFMYSSSEMSGYMDPERVKSQTLIKTLFAQLNLYSRTPELETLRLLVPHRNKQSAQEPPHEQILPQGAVQRATEACLTKVEESRQKDVRSAFFERQPRILQQRPPSKYSSSSERTRHQMMEQALQQYPTLMSKERILLTHQHPGLSTSTMNARDAKHDCLHLRPEQLVANHIQNWPSNDLLRNVDGLIVGMIL